MAEAEVRATQVDLSGLMTVLGEHLYSTPTVALRELVQNAHDSCTRRRIEAADAFTPSIRVIPDRATGTLAVEDNGAGLTHDEVVQYLATVGAGYTRRLRQATADDGLIGLFGLGFLSAFVVSERIDVWTTSYQSPELGFHYASKSGERYSLEACDARPIGTRVQLTLKEKFHALLERAALRPILARYGALLPFGVRLDGDDADINAVPPPWREPAENPLKARRARLAFAARFESRFEPLCTFAVRPLDKADARGMLWVQDGATYGTSDNRNLAVFVRGMLLDDDARDLLPAWAGFVGGVIESVALTPTASREDLQRDAAYTATQAALIEAIVLGLAEVARREPEAWRRVLSRHNEALLGAAICEPRLFDLLADELTVPTSEGDLTMPVIQKRSERRFHVSLATRGGFEEMLFRALKVPIASGTRYGVLPFVQRWCERHGGTVVQLGTSEGNEQVFRAQRLDTSSMAVLEATLALPGQRIVPARFAPKDLPLVLVPDRDVELKRRLESDEADKRIASAALGLARLFTAKVDGAAEAHLYVNVDSPAIAALLERVPDRDDPGPRMLRALASLMTGAGDSAGKVDLATTLADYTATVCALLRAPGAR